LNWWPFRKMSMPSYLSPEMQRIFEKAIHFLDDEVAQNNSLPEPLRAGLTQNPSCDQIPNGRGKFGQTITNPVPVNGPIGELIYLSRLETTEGIPITFHRLGAFNEVDIFEIMSDDGRYWDFLYFSLYYPRKSQFLPSGYKFVSDKKRPLLIRGTTRKLNSFPKGIFRATCECTEKMLGVAIADSRLMSLDKRTGFLRPQKHSEALRLRTYVFSRSTSTDHSTSTDPIAENAMSDDDNPLFKIFSGTFNSLKLFTQETATESNAQLRVDYERQLTYLLLYVFTTLFFKNISRNEGTLAADHLTRWCLTRLSRNEGVHFKRMLEDYRHQFNKFRDVGILTKTSGEIEVASFVSRLLVQHDSVLFGIFMVRGMVQVFVSLQEEMMASLARKTK